MKTHEIELEPLQEWMATHETHYASSTKERKRLTVTVSGTFKVYHHNEVVWQGTQPFRAIQEYNEII